jgi:hypothetical protein
MEEKNEGVFSKGTILIVLILFMFSSRILDITWDIGKSLIYLILIIYGVNYLNPSLAKKIKEIITDFINIDSNGYFIKDTLSKLSSNVLNGIKSDEKSNIPVKTEQDMVIKNDILRNEINRNLENISVTSNRKLS